MAISGCRSPENAVDPCDVLSLSSVPSAALSRLGVHQSLLSKFPREIQERGPICSTRRRSALTFSTPFPASALTRCPYHFRFFLFTAIVLGEGRRGNLGAVIPDLPAFCRTRSSCFFFLISGILESRSAVSSSEPNGCVRALPACGVQGD